MAPKRQYKCARKMIDGQIVNNVNLTKLLFQSLQMIHHVSLMRKQAEGSPVSTFLHKIAELDRFTRPARPHSDVIKRIQTLNRSWAKQQIGIDKSEGENFKVYDNYWSTGHNGHGRNMYGKLRNSATVSMAKDDLATLTGKTLRPCQHSSLRETHLTRTT